MGPSGCGKTSLLRAMSGLWKTGSGKITYYVKGGENPEQSIGSDVNTSVNNAHDANEERGKSISRKSGIFFLPQRPYMVLGSLRQQLLYPTWGDDVVPMSDDTNQKSMWFLVSFPSTPKYITFSSYANSLLFFKLKTCLLLYFCLHLVCSTAIFETSYNNTTVVVSLP